jgi:Ca2+-transporting ATPase
MNSPDASFVDSIGIVLAVLLATLAGFFSELKSAKEFDLLNKVKDDILIKVLRSGAVHEVSINDLVVGDVVLLALGDKVPADGVVTESFGLLVDQSVMTGESVPVEKYVFEMKAGCAGDSRSDRINSPNDPVAPRCCAPGFHSCEESQVYRGTMISDGRGRFVVTQVGDQTRLGQIAANLGAAASESETPLVQKLSKLADQISKVGITAAVLIFLVMAFFAFNAWTPDWTLNGILPLLKELLTAFIIAVAIVVVAVPEGLPMMVTVALALNMMKMAKENCLIRKLVASETIGSATVICSDKTGTLTQNKMTVTWGFAGLQDIASGGTLNPLLVDAVALNNEAAINIVDGKIEDIGNPTECALLRFLHAAGIDYRETKKQYPLVWELSHNSARKMSLVAINKGDQRVIYAKGAPERLISCCSHVMVNGEREAMEQHRKSIDDALLRAQYQALRVIAVTIKQTAQSDMPENFPESFKAENAERFTEHCDNTLIALIGISDPIRAEVPHAVETCRIAGIDVKMITGDAKPTAVAIAKQAGILGARAGGVNPPVSPDELILTSEELATLSDDELVEKIPHLKVLARSTPMDKLRLVRAMHRQGAVVAMTGDGTNDAPALKNADVGISMGITGTEVAKEASDIVLIDDNFKSIVTGVWWGRTLYQNIQRFLIFQLTVNVVALTVAFLGPLVGVQLPLTVPQLLWINIIMDTFAAIALCTEPPRERSMRRKPIKRDDSIITPAMGVTILLTAVYQVAILAFVLFGGWFVEKRFEFGADLRSPEILKGNIEALTVFFTAFVLFQFWNILNCRALRWDESPFALLLRNKSFLVIITIIAVVQVGLVQCSGSAENNNAIGEVFRTVALSPMQWIQIALLTITIIPVAWGIRFVVHSLGLYGER